MKTATYQLLDGSDITIEYDPDAPCWYCGKPVREASMGGTVVCPLCDCGCNRDGSKWTIKDANRCFARFLRMKAANEAQE